MQHVPAQAIKNQIPTPIKIKGTVETNAELGSIDGVIHLDIRRIISCNEINNDIKHYQ